MRRSVCSLRLVLSFCLLVGACTDRPGTSVQVAGTNSSLSGLAVSGSEKKAPQDARSNENQAATLTGRAVDQRGEPLADTLVRVAIPAVDVRHVFPGSGHTTVEARTGKDGRYKIQLPLKSATTVSFDALKPGFRSSSGTLQSGGDRIVRKVDRGTTAHASFVLESALYVAGVVVDEKDVPVPGVRVVATDWQTNSHGYIAVTASSKPAKG